MGTLVLALWCAIAVGTVWIVVVAAVLVHSRVKRWLFDRRVDRELAVLSRRIRRMNRNQAGVL